MRRGFSLHNISSVYVVPLLIFRAHASKNVYSLQEERTLHSHLLFNTHFESFLYRTHKYITEGFHTLLL